MIPLENFQELSGSTVTRFNGFSKLKCNDLEKMLLEFVTTCKRGLQHKNHHSILWFVYFSWFFSVIMNPYLFNPPLFQSSCLEDPPRA